MLQRNRALEKMSKNEISRVVTTNFLKTIEEIVRKGIYEDIKNESDLAVFTDISHSSISRLKTDENRYVTLEMILKIVNKVGANSNNLFVIDEKQKEELIREKFVDASRSGNTNNITNSKVKSFIQGPVINGDNYKGDINTYQRIINNIPVKYRKELKEALQSITAQNGSLNNQVKDLKKTLAQHERAIKAKDLELSKKEKELEELRRKESELNEIARKYILLLEETKTVAKK
jgi:DNA-binding Xre family transcriptional regulator